MKSCVECQSLSEYQLEFPSYNFHNKGSRAEEELPEQSGRRVGKRGEKRKHVLPGPEICTYGLHCRDEVGL
jgi:hypothetical protein